MNNEQLEEAIKGLDEGIRCAEWVDSFYADTLEVQHLKTALAAMRECREREVGCGWCKHYEDLPEHFINGNPVGKVYDTSITQDEMGRWHIELPRDADIGIQFCPMCGRRLTEGSAE